MKQTETSERVCFQARGLYSGEFVLMQCCASHTAASNCHLCDCSLIATVNWWKMKSVTFPSTVSDTKLAAAGQSKQI